MSDVAVPEQVASASILVVDDEAPIRRILSRTLERMGHRCTQAADVIEARKAIERDSFDLVVSDVNMPGESGMDLVKDLFENHPDVAVMMVTGVDDPALAEEALDLGAYGYVIKPFEMNEIAINVSNALRRRALELENARHREHLEAMVKERTADLWRAVQQLEQARDDLRSSQAETIHRLTLAAEFRDDETGAHIQRMSHYCGLLAQKVTGDAEQAEVLQLASVMHDVGKIGIPDSILLKPRKLTPDEYEAMKQHAELGHRILSGGSSELLQLAASIALTHHEKVDGSGYPHGLAGDDIPIEGRIAAIADVFDAVTTDRVYRKAFTLAEALQIMREGRGTHFDAELLDVFFDSMDLVLRIKEEHE